MSRRRWTSAAALLAAGALAAPAGAQRAIPIPGPLDGPLPRFSGGPVQEQPLKGPFPPHNPALAPDGTSGTGLAAANGAASPSPGPLGKLTQRSSAFQFGTCAGLAFDLRHRLLTLCTGVIGPALRLVDPGSLDTLATLNLPPRRSTELTDVSGGTHFVVRADGSLLLPTNDGALVTVRVGDAALTQTGKLDLTGLLAGSERPFAVAAGFDGRDWVAGTAGTVVTVPREGGAPRALALGEPIAEDLATDPTGTFVVTQRALYRLRARADGTPEVIWREPVPAGMRDARAGRVHEGSGTPPAIVAGGYVAVADAVNPPRLLVARIGGADDRRLACSVPLFRPSPGSVEAQLVVAGRSVVVANAYGYENPLTTEGGRTTTGGLARVIVGKRGCRTAWTSRLITPSVNAVVSRRTGLLYTVEKPAGFPDAWNLAAIDWRTGEVRFRALAGEGLGFNSNGGAMALGPDGMAYAGSFGGVTRWADLP